MLGDNIDNVDDEVNNELIMPVDKPKQPDMTKEEKKKEKSKKKCDRKSNKKEYQDKTLKKSKQDKAENGKPASTTTTTVFPSSPKSPGSPRGVLKVTRCELRKGKPNKYIAKPLKCSMCDKVVKSKEELRNHHQDVHNIISCKECRKGFVTKQSLRKHTYTHTTKNNYECILCKKSYDQA